MKLRYSLLILFCLSLPAWAVDSQWDHAETELEQAVDIKVYRSPDCECCHRWIEHLQQHNFNVIDIITPNMASVKQELGLPAKLASCHTAEVDGYIIEGHVPADDIKRLLNEKPAIKGLAVPAMPVGTPGMEMAERRDPFAVIQFDSDAHFAVYNFYRPDGDNHYQAIPPEQ